MANNLILLTVSSRTPENPESGTLAVYLDQLAAAGIDSYVEYITVFPNMNGGGTLGAKVVNLRALVESFAHYEKIVITDAFDVQFFGTRDDVLAKIPDDGVLLAAERNCYPEPQLAEIISGETAWRFVNGGMLCGTPVSLLNWLYAVEGHPAYEPNALDQAWLNRRLSEGSPLVNLDSRTNLFYCLYNEKEELGFANGLPINTVTGKKPNFIHSNGQSGRSDIWDRYTRSLQ